MLNEVALLASFFYFRLKSWNEWKRQKTKGTKYKIAA